MKKIIILFLLAILVSNISAQSTTAITIAPVNANVNNRYLGWDNNVIPLWFKTEGVVRARINNTLTSTINGVNQNVSGYFGIGVNDYFSGNTPVSMLHLAGAGSSGLIAGWRPWMKTGIFLQESSDGMYIGMQDQGGTNRVDAIINWNDDQSGVGGPEKLKFVFTGAKLSNNVNNNPLDGKSTKGYEIMQLTPFPDIVNSSNFPVGYVGIGPVFTTTLPQSRLHINSEDNLETWIQVTNQTVTGQLATDGFRIGINSNGTANLKQQENSPMIFSVNSIETMRISPTVHGNFTGIGGNSTNLYRNNTQNPTQTLEVNSTALTTGPSNSGLRFTDLNSTVTPLETNPGTGVLAVNANGDVIYVKNNATGGVANAENGCSINGNNNVVLGNNLGLTTSILTSHREIPMNKFDLLFSQEGRIAIGDYFTTGTNLPTAKLDIHSDNESNPLALNVRSDNAIVSGNYTMSEFDNFSTDGGESVAINVHTNGNAVKRGVGVNILVDNTTSWTLGENVGLICDARNALRYNTGAKFSAVGEVESNIGISAIAHAANGGNVGGSFSGGNPDYTINGYNGVSNYGIYTRSFGGEKSYGIYAEAIGGSAENWAGYFVGDVYISGSYGPSDIMLKENITPLTNSTSVLNQLSPKNFTFKTTEFPQMNLPTGTQFGLIAQDVEPILPELVKNVTQPAVLDSVGNVITPAITFKSVKYESFIPILIEGVKEVNAKNDSTVAVLNTRIDSLQNVISNFNTRMAQFENQLNDCCNNGHNGHHGGNKSSSENENSLNLTEVVLENSNTVLLEQNVPNPFAESTTINYFIPENIKYAQLLFSDNFGRIIKTVDITTSGAGTIKVYASNLSQGTYTYCLVVDGKIVETKKMVCVK